MRMLDSEVIPMIIVFSIPIIAILTAHQRKMAELIHGKSEQGAHINEVLHELRRLNDKVTVLEDKVNQSVINSDLQMTPPRLTERELEQRIGEP